MRDLIDACLCVWGVTQIICAVAYYCSVASGAENVWFTFAVLPSFVLAIATVVYKLGCYFRGKL